MSVPGLQPCCQEQANLVLQETPEDAPEGLELRVCSACNRRHYELTVDPAVIGLDVSSL